MSPRRLHLLLCVAALAACSGGTRPSDPAAPRSLMDRPIRAASVPAPAADPVLGALSGAEEIWFLDRPFQPWNVFPASPPDAEPQRWRGVPTLAVAGGGHLAPTASLSGPAGRDSVRPVGEGVPLDGLARGQVLVDPRGVHVVTRTRKDKPPAFRPTYPTRSADLRERLAPGPPTEGSLLPAQHLTFGEESRRAVRVLSGTTITWPLSPSDAGLPLELGFGRDRWGLRLIPGCDPPMLEAVETSDVELTFRVTWSAEGLPARTLWEDVLPAGASGAIHEARVEALPPHASGAALSFEVTAAGPGGDDGPAGAGRGFWFDPAVQLEAAADRPNVLLVILDTLRADRLGCYGYGRPTSPRLDALAREGVVIDRAWSAAPWTLPSHASLFSSLHAVEHGVFDASVRLPEEARTIAEVLLDAGYDTAAFTEAGYVRPELGLAQGFQRFRCALNEVDETFRGAADWIEGRERPFFALVHTYKVHTPYDPEGPARELLVRPYDGPLPRNARVDDVPPADRPHGYSAEDARYLSDLYDAEIRELDDALGDFMDRLRQAGALENTLVVITADHGEEFAEHGQFNHSNSLYEEQLRVPLILLPPAPGALDGLRPDVAAMAVDVAPTIAQVADAPVPAGWSGRSLLEARGADEDAPDRWVLFRPAGSEEMTYALERDGVKLIWYPEGLRPEDTNPTTTMFELAADPGEQAGVSSLEWTLHGAAETVRTLKEAHPRRHEGSSSVSSPELKAQLAELGYATGND